MQCKGGPGIIYLWNSNTPDNGLIGRRPNGFQVLEVFNSRMPLATE
jgi:hypothetical protein